MRHELIALKRLKNWITHRREAVDEENRQGVSLWEHYKFNVGYLRALTDIDSAIIELENQLME